jgi:hypothetical protein
MKASAAPLGYRLDAHDRVRAITGPWDRVAAENSAPELLSSHVVDQPLWRFIAGDDVRGLLHLLFARARSSGATLQLPFRCDSPRERRFMELRVQPMPRSELLVESVLLRTEPRSYMPLLERSAHLLYGTLTICSWCRRVRLFDQEWVDLEEAVARMNLFASAELPALREGICRACIEQTTSLSGIAPSTPGVPAEAPPGS